MNEISYSSNRIYSLRLNRDYKKYLNDAQKDILDKSVFVARFDPKVHDYLKR